MSRPACLVTCFVYKRWLPFFSSSSSFSPSFLLLFSASDFAASVGTFVCTLHRNSTRKLNDFNLRPAINVQRVQQKNCCTKLCLFFLSSCVYSSRLPWPKSTMAWHDMTASARLTIRLHTSTYTTTAETDRQIVLGG